MKIDNFSDSCIFLLGAGISADAGIPISTELNKKVRSVIQSQYPDPNSLQQRLYNYLVGSIYFQRGLTNINPENSPVNIEEILSCLHLLKNKNTQLLSAFVGNWHNFINDFSDSFLHDFERTLRSIVVDSLKGSSTKMTYFNWFKDLHQSYNSTINIFTLNQDIILETVLQDYGYVNGFDNEGIWNPELFDGAETENGNSINIYKLHGSLGWKKNEYDQIKCDENEMISVNDKHLMIFGILDKVTLDEPYFELIKRFKELSKKASLIVTIGYSFSDTHINNILFESLRIAKNKKILIVSRKPENLKTRIKEKYSQSVNLSLFDSLGGRTAGELLKSNELNNKIEEILKSTNDAPF